MFNDSAVFTASTGYIFTGAVGTAAPTREQIRDFDPDSFGAHSFTVKVTGSGKFTLSVGGKATTELATSAKSDAVQSALEKVDTVGSGGVVVTGDSLTTGLNVAFIGSNYGKKVTLTGTGVGTSAPTVSVKESSKPSGWVPLGHTALDDLPEFGYEGGETSVKGSWQKKNLRENVTEAPVDYVTFKALQFDPETLELYYGKNASKVAGVFGVDNPAEGTAERAILIVLVDGPFKIGFTAAKTSIRRDESIQLSNEDMSMLPLRSTFVKHPGRHLFEWVLPAE